MVPLTKRTRPRRDWCVYRRPYFFQGATVVVGGTIHWVGGTIHWVGGTIRLVGGTIRLVGGTILFVIAAAIICKLTRLAPPCNFFSCLGQGKNCMGARPGFVCRLPTPMALPMQRLSLRYKVPVTVSEMGGLVNDVAGNR